ncbi:hypothetical protein EON80_17715, partial [bacterium]
MNFGKFVLASALFIASGSHIGCALAQQVKTEARQPAKPITGYANDRAGVVISRGSSEYLHFDWTVWGPNWAWTGLEGQTTAKNGVSSGELTGKLGGTDVGAKIAFRAERVGPRSLKITYSGSIERDSALTMMIAAFDTGAAFQGRDVEVTTEAGVKTIKLPFGRQGLGDKVRNVKLTDAENLVTTLKFDPPIDIVSDGAARIVLAKDQLKAGDVGTASITVELPNEVKWYGGVDEIPDEPGIENWYPWKATGDTGDSLLSLANWNNQPAGQFGRISRRGSELIYNDKPIKLWGLNLCYAATAPEKALADKRAAFYKKNGINAVRLHKWADGSGWAGILSPESAVEFDAAALDRFDYQVAKFKEA